ncbi:MAG: hypothetical protein ABSC90_04575 [Acidimicrobiales bacterium]
MPGVSCSAAASALAPAGLSQVCGLTSGVAGSAVSQVAGLGVDSVLNDLGSWVADGASWLLAQVGTVLGATTGVDLGASWFSVHYQTMAELAGVVIVPLLLLGIVQSVYRQDASRLVRSVLVNVPLAVLLTAVAVQLVQLGLSVTDSMSAAVAQSAGLDTGHFMASVTLGLTGATAAGQPPAPAFVLFLGALAVVVGAVLVWVELLIRSSAVYVAVLFLPLALASLAWPAISHWCRRLVDTLVALILGKFVIVSVLSLAVGALAGGTGSTPGGAAPTDGSGGGFGAVLGGAALLLLAGLAPWALFRLLPFVEAGAVGHLEALSHRARQTATAPIRGLAQTAVRMSAAGALAGAAAGVGSGAAAGAASGGSGGERRGGAASPSGGRSGPGGVAGPGGAAPDPGPDPGPSSVASTGVGTMDAPGHSIPLWPVHQEATAVANQLGAMGDADDPETSDVSSTGLVGPLTPLPRQSGAFRADALGRDELGIRLVAAPTTPPGKSWPGTDGGGPGRSADDV